MKPNWGNFWLIYSTILTLTAAYTYTPHFLNESEVIPNLTLIQPNLAVGLNLNNLYS